MKKITILFALAVLLSVVFSSCRDKTYIEILGPDGKPIESPGRLIVDDKNLPQGIKPDLIDDGGNKIGEITPGIPVDVEAGTYKLIVVTPRDGLTVSGTAVSLSTADNQSVSQAPEFRAGVSTVTVIEDKVTEAKLSLSAMTRELIVRLTLTGINPADVVSIEADVFNPASTVDVEKGFGAVIASPGAERYVRTTNNPTSTKEEINFRLLGFAVQGNHRLIIRLRIDDKTEEQTFDISNHVAGFNNGPAGTPVYVDVAIEQQEGKFTGTIEPWEPGWEEEIPGV